MDTTISNGAHFDRYFALLRDLCPTVNGIIAFNKDLEVVWRDGNNSVDPKQVKLLVHNFLGRGNNEATMDLGEGVQVELISLKDQQRPTLVLCLCFERDESPQQPLVTQERVILLNNFLLAANEQSIALANQEDELNLMTDELTRRYEELNLIYKAEDQALNIHHGRELLRQLVTNTSRFLNVDVIYLYIAGKNIAMHKFKDDNPVFQSDSLFEILRDTVLPLLEIEHSAIVINHNEEASQFGLVQDMPFKFVASPVVDAESKVIGLLAIASQNFAVDFTNSDRNLLDVMSKKASKIAQSHFDPLTGLENNNSFELILKDLLKQSRGTDVNHAIANIDIDRMAVVNDISGRDAGDMLIKKVGQQLASLVRARDVVARIGSDKFGVLLENCDLPTAQTVMKKISHAVSSIDMEWEGHSHEVSVSIGIAPINAQAESVTSLLNAAETARNVSKERGRNVIHVLEMEDSSLLHRKEQIRWVGRIQSALRDDRFLLYAQRIQPLCSEVKLPHYEILLRMQDDDGNVIAPDKFLSAAENFYLMSSIDYWVINQVFYEMAQIYQNPNRQNCQISINLSGQSLSDAVSFSAYIENKLEHYQLDANDICFEITESAAIANIDDARVFIDQVHALGCKFSLDDFGTGLSSFAYLKNLHVDYLKIDGSFVRDIVKDPVCESMVSAINQVGQAMHLQTVAEYVENDEIMQKLIKIGVNFGQGYGIEMPAPLSETLSSLTKPSSKSA